tara:strand:+ start:539 stop:658 length:120 start_codon:yes stop_codon:yes gene_type:complete
MIKNPAVIIIITTITVIWHETNPLLYYKIHKYKNIDTIN